METVLGWSDATTWPSPLPKWHMPKWMTTVLAGIDWKETGALIGVIATVAFALKTLLRPFGEKVAYSLLKERIERFEKATELAQANADKIEMLEASVIQIGTAIRDIPRLITTTETLCETISKLDGTLRRMDQDMRDIGERQKYMEGVWDGQERRKGPRRADDG